MLFFSRYTPCLITSFIDFFQELLLMNSRLYVYPFLISTVFLLSCSSDSEDPVPASPVTLSGIISAPGSTSFAKVETIKNRFASWLMNSANAAIGSGTGAIGAGVAVKLVDLTDGSELATGITTADGSYTLDAPSTFTAGAQFVVRAGSTDVIEARVISTNVDVDVSTHVSSQLISEIATGSTISNLTVDEVTQIQEEISASVDTTENDVDSLTTLSEITTELVESAKSEDETINVITSTAATGSICGTVTDNNDAPLANIRMVARDYGNWVTRAKSKTDATGAYCLNVPVKDETVLGEAHNGEFIVGAINRTGDGNDPLLSASEWYTSSGGGIGQWQGDKISLTSAATSATADFKLALGARIKGSVMKSADGTAAKGVKVIIRDFKTWMPITGAKVKSDGTYRVNVPPGDYIVVARNRTRKALATEVFHDADGNGTSDQDVFIRQEGSKVTVAAGDKFTANFNLVAGNHVKGKVTKGDDSAAAGVRVRFNNNGFAAALRTNKKGFYRIGLKPDTYVIRSRGQTRTVDITSASDAKGFKQTVTPVTTTITYNGAAVSEVVALLRYKADDATNSISANQLVSQEISNSDGSITLYIPDTTKDYILQLRVKDGNSGAASITYKTQTTGNTEYADNWTDGTAVTSTSFPTEIRLPAGNEVTGTVTVSGVAKGRQKIIVRKGGNNSSFNVVTTTSLGDGSYYLYLPATTYDRFLACTIESGSCSSTLKQSQDNVVVPLTSPPLSFSY